MFRQSPLRHAAGTILFASALVLGSSNASASCAIGVAAPTSTVTPQGSGAFAYDYTVSGAAGSCVDFHGPANYVVDAFELPYFADAGITGIRSPAGWTATIVDADTFGLGNGAQTLLWTASAGYGIAPTADFSQPAATLSGFGYTAGFTAAYSPAGVQLAGFGQPDIVDPALPASPLALQAGLQPAQFPPLSSVPEPSAWLAMLAGVGCLAIVRRRRG